MSYSHLGYELVIYKDNCMYHGECVELGYYNSFDDESELVNHFASYVESL